MDETDRDYFARRAGEERRYAESAGCAEARCVHLRLAEAYERIVGRIVEPMAMPLPPQPS